MLNPLWHLNKSVDLWNKFGQTMMLCEKSLFDINRSVIINLRRICGFYSRHVRAKISATKSAKECINYLFVTENESDCLSNWNRGAIEDIEILINSTTLLYKIICSMAHSTERNSNAIEWKNSPFGLEQQHIGNICWLLVWASLETRTARNS